MWFNPRRRMWHNRLELDEADPVYRDVLTIRENILPALTRSNPVWVPYQVQSHKSILSIDDMYNATFCDEAEEHELYHIYDGSRTLVQAHELRHDHVFLMYMSCQDINPSSLKCKVFVCFDFIDPADGANVFAVVPEDAYLDDWSITLVALVAGDQVGLPPGVDKDVAMGVVLFKPSKQELAVAVGEPGKHDKWVGNYARTVWNASVMNVYFLFHQLVFEGNRLVEIKHHVDAIQGMMSADEDDAEDNNYSDDEDSVTPPLAKRPRV